MCRVFVHRQLAASSKWPSPVCLASSQPVRHAVLDGTPFPCSGPLCSRLNDAPLCGRYAQDPCVAKPCIPVYWRKPQVALSVVDDLCPNHYVFGGDYGHCVLGGVRCAIRFTFLSCFEEDWKERTHTHSAYSS